MNPLKSRIKKLEQLSGIQRIMVASGKVEIEATAKQCGIDLEGESVIWVMTEIENPTY